MPRRLSRETLYHSPWIDLFGDRVEMPDGQIIERYHVLHYPREAVGVVITDDAGRVLLVHSSRYVAQRLEWEIPAGCVETGETPEQAARRESLEESGCTLATLERLCVMEPDNSMSDQKVHLFRARVLREADIQDTAEIAGKKWIERAALDQMLTKQLQKSTK